MGSRLVHHFSEDDTLRSFTPHVPRTNPTQDPAVWAIDTEHAPLYWFPRDCPRVAVWPRTEEEQSDYSRTFATVAPRLHVIELGWFERMETTKLFRYDFDAADFEPWPDASGHWVSRRTVEPVDIVALGDLVAMHAHARVELRLVDSLFPVVELANDDRWDFSIVRLANAVGFSAWDAGRSVQRRQKSSGSS